MLYILGTNNHALTIVERWWQLTEHVLYIRGLSRCYDRCPMQMITDEACFYPEGYITMLWPLSIDDGNRWSMFHTWGIDSHALTVPWVDDNWRNMFHTWGINNHALTMSGDDDNWRSMFHIWRGLSPCSERYSMMITTDGACFCLEGYIPCSDRCHETTEHVSYLSDI